MKFECIRTYFINALGIVGHVVEKNTALPILQNVLLHTTKGGRVTLSATNLEIGVHASFQAKVTEEGVFTVPLQVLEGFLANASDEKVLCQVKGSEILVSAGAHKANIKGLDAKDFPIIPTLTEEFSATMPLKELCTALSSLVFLTSPSDIRPDLAGVFCSFEKEKVRLAATDSFRLGERILRTTGLQKEASCIIPTRTVVEFLRAFSGSGENIEILMNTNQILFKLPERELISRLVEGKYPEYTAIIPTSFGTRAHLHRDEFVRMLRAASIFSGKNRDVKINILPDKNKLVIESRNSDIGEHTSEIQCEGEGKPLSIVCNYQYFVDALSKIEDESVSLEGNGETDPVMLKGSVNLGTKYLIMPLRSY